MAMTIKREEAIPSAYPDVPDNLSTDATALNSDMIWQRLESYIAHRWSDREVIWTIEGDGCWQPDLTPATITTVQVWENYNWSDVTLNASPLGGYELTGEGPYQITANVGSGDVPAAVLEAFRRLAEYMAEDEKHPGAASFKTSVDPIDLEQSRTPNWLARAMQYSGAADLLRPYRRA